MPRAEPPAFIDSGALRPAEVPRRSFDTVRRGLDPGQVRAYLEQVADELARLEGREADLRRRLADAERRAANPQLDEATLTRALGQETARILSSVREAANDMRARAEENAGQILEEARQEAARVRAAAEMVLAERTAEAEGSSESIVEAVRAQAAEQLEQARAQARELAEQARTEAREVADQARAQGREVVREAQELRARVLSDLARRRRVLHLQVERLRAGRESLLEAVRSAKSSLVTLDEGLARAEADARMAAEAAARQVASEPEHGVEEMETALALGRQAELLGRRRAGATEEMAGATEEMAGATEGGPQAARSPALAGAPAPPAVGPVRAPAEPGQAYRGQADEPAPEPAEPAVVPDEPAQGRVEPAPVLADPAPEPADPEPPTPPAGSLPPAVAMELPFRPPSGTLLAEEPDPEPSQPLARQVEVGKTARAAASDRDGASPGDERRGSQARSASEAGDGTRRSLDALFARLRGVTDCGQGRSAAEPRDRAGDGATSANGAPAGADGPGEARHTGKSDRDGEQARDGEWNPAVAAEARLQRRDEAIEPIVGRLARKLKRALQDDQNALLDRVRSHGASRRIELADDAGSQADLFRRASSEALEKAVLAGAAFAQEAMGPGVPGAATTPSSSAAGEQSEQLAATLVGALRPRLEAALHRREEGDDAGMMESIGAAYREWKGERIERLAGDYVVAAFAVGVLGAAVSEAQLTWVVDDDGIPCPDCDDNALAGPLAAGTVYPTGQAHPPAHPGCRCLLVPARA